MSSSDKEMSEYQCKVCLMKVLELEGAVNHRLVQHEDLIDESDVFAYFNITKE